MERNIVVRYVSSKIAPAELVENLIAKTKSYLPEIPLIDGAQDPDVICFLTGGSEFFAKEDLRKDKFYILLAGRDHNAFAAAMETKAWMNSQGYRSVLLPLNDRKDAHELEKYLRAQLVFKNLNDKNIAVIGKISPWLIASAVDAKLLKSRLGLVLKNISWSRIPLLHKYRVLASFAGEFGYTNSVEMDEAGRIYQALCTIIQDEKLSGLAVECFSLIGEIGVSACLPLSKINSDGIPAACEGDLVSLLGMLIAKEVCGIIPWMANSLGKSGDKLGFAHCTISKSLIENFSIVSHYETGKPYAIKGELPCIEITALRLSNNFQKAHMFTGNIVPGPELQNACRTQVWIKCHNPEILNSFIENSYGNHTLIIPGNKLDEMYYFFKVAGVELD